MRKNNPYFHFKRFSINHARSTMKVGTDGVLLGCWVAVDNAEQILDIGTGSGLIAIMLAQRSGEKTLIQAVEIESSDAAQAVENVQQSPWPDKIQVHHCAIQEFYPPGQFDVIVSNPPYFINSFEPPDKKRSGVRHTINLSFEELLAASQRLLSPKGRLNVVLPVVEGERFLKLASEENLLCTRQWVFRSRHNKLPERLLLELSKEERTTETGEIVMYDGNEWTPEFKNLSREFYLKI